MEAVAIWEGLKIISVTLKANNLLLIIEFDALEIINILIDKDEDLSEAKNIAEAIKNPFHPWGM